MKICRFLYFDGKELRGEMVEEKIHLTSVEGSLGAS